METKELILNKSLKLFSDKGYEGVSMRDIASEVGIKAASIYNHFKGKEDIFCSLLEEMSRRYEMMREMTQIPVGDVNSVAKSYVGISEKNLLKIARSLFLYFLNDEFAAPFRRMVTIEQYRHSVAGETFKKMFIHDVLNYETYIFTYLVQQKEFVECNPQVAALHFYSPIFLLLSKYDLNKKSQEEALQLLDNHVKQFSSLYIKKTESQK